MASRFLAQLSHFMAMTKKWRERVRKSFRGMEINSRLMSGISIIVGHLCGTI